MGKKRKYTEQVGVLFEPETLRRLNEKTDGLDMSNSEFIRGIVEDILTEGATVNEEEKNEK